MGWFKKIVSAISLGAFDSQGSLAPAPVEVAPPVASPVSASRAQTSTKTPTTESSINTTQLATTNRRKSILAALSSSRISLTSSGLLSGAKTLLGA